MMPAKLLEGPCSKCGQTISYPAGLVGTAGKCPMCGQMTQFVLGEPAQEPVIQRRTIVFTIIAILVLLLGLVAAAVALKRAKELKKNNPQASLTVVPDSSKI